MALTTTTDSGTQGTTQSPQSAGQAGATGTSSSSVQPGTANSLLDSQSGGVPLGGTALTTVNLASQSGTAAGNATIGTSTPKVTPHHVNASLFAVPLLLLVVAVALFWFASKAEKNTTI